MTFNFPDNKTINKGIIQTYYENRGRQFFDNIDILTPKDNLIEINGVDYFFTYLEGATPGNKGGNSILLKLYDSQYIDLEDIEYNEPDLVLKISKFKKSHNPKWADNKEKRFVKEIKALNDCQDHDFQNVIKIYHNGVCRIKNYYTNRFDEHLFYTMEYAESDLKEYIELNHDSLDIYEKLAFCISLCEGLNELFSIGYYHRDLKPDNIFIIRGVWKIGDLGLIDDRKKINDIDKVAEPIGPKGWMSPESMNKYLCEGKNFKFKHNCSIDHQSDIFQLGKVFWYIFQYNAPIGSVKEKDFYIKNTRIYSVLKTMLSHSKQRRFKEVNDIIKLWKILEKDMFKRMVA
jgi:serine/threonine protein kinase